MFDLYLDGLSRQGNRVARIAAHGAAMAMTDGNMSNAI